jgi:hypothetical protein
LVQLTQEILNMKYSLVCLSLALACASLSGFAAPPSGGDFVITKNTIDNGGGRTFGGDFELTGTIAQQDASEQDSSGGEFRLSGGFWASVAESIFKDGFESGP